MCSLHFENNFLSNLMCSLRFENNLLTIEGVCFASISKKTPLSKLSFAFISLALPLLVETSQFMISLVYVVTVYPQKILLINPPIGWCSKLGNSDGGRKSSNCNIVS